MKLCRYDDDRMGVVRGDLVHDVTEAQTEIRKSMPYAMKGDAVVAALPQWRERIERMADKAPGKPIAQRQIAAAGGAADQADLRADQLPGAYRGDGKGFRSSRAHRSCARSRPRSSKPECSSRPIPRWSARRKAFRSASRIGATTTRSSWSW